MGVFCAILAIVLTSLGLLYQSSSGLGEKAASDRRVYHLKVVLARTHQEVIRISGDMQMLEMFTLLYQRVSVHD